MASNADRDVELEDGECSNSDSELIEFTSPSPVTPAPNKDINAEGYTYRSRIPQIVINSDESDDDSDDCPSAWKKTRSPLNNSHGNGDKIEDIPFVNPLLSNNTDIINSASIYGHRKKNNIWGSVLTEQVLSQEVKLFGMDNSVVLAAARDVESYDFTQAKDDERPELDIEPDEIDNSRDDIFDESVDLEKDVSKYESRKRKRHVKKHPGKRSYSKEKKRALGVNANDDASDVAVAIAKGLAEPKVELFSEIVEKIGNDLAIKLYYMTENIQECGGMMTNDGSRRRTPGGVYIQLLKMDKSISPELVESIFREQQQEWKEKRKEKRKIKKAAKRRRKRQTRRDMDIDRPDTPAPTEDLEVLNAHDSNSEFENTDLPERPATPEPKDDSSDGQDVDDDEEEEDISIAIAKAKAAILKKQRELASGNVADSEKLLGDSSYMTSVDKTSELISSDKLINDVEIGDMEDV